MITERYDGTLIARFDSVPQLFKEIEQHLKDNGVELKKLQSLFTCYQDEQVFISPY